jgi:hypothetical protein
VEVRKLIGNAGGGDASPQETLLECREDFLTCRKPKWFQWLLAHLPTISLFDRDVGKIPASSGNAGSSSNSRPGQARFG